MALPATVAQLNIAIASLARSLTLPSVNGNQTGIVATGGNQLAIPIDSSAQGLYNQQLGGKLQITADSQFIYIQQNVGDVALG